MWRFLCFMCMIFTNACGNGYTDLSSLKIEPSGEGAQAERNIGINAINLLDDLSYGKNNFRGIPHWKENIDYAQWLGAKFIRVSASYEAGRLERAKAMAQKICSYYRYNQNVKYLVAFSDMNLGGRTYSSDYKMIEAWYNGKADQTDYWQYAKTLINEINGNCSGAIYSWEMGNEVFCRDCFYDFSSGKEVPLSISEQKKRRSHYEFFLTDLASRVKKLSTPDQKFGLGIVRAGWASVYVLNGQPHGGFDNGHGVINYNFKSEQELFSGSPYLFVNWLDVFANPNIDFMTLHYYGLVDKYASKHKLRDQGTFDPISLFFSDLRLAELTGKPVMIEEFGSTPSDTGSYMGDPLRDVRTESFLQIIDWAKNHNIETIVPWQATFYGFQRTGMSWLGGSCYYDPKAISSQRCQIETALMNYGSP